MTKARMWLISILITGIACSFGLLGADGNAIEWQLEKTDDSVKLTSNDKEVRVAVESKSGIGGCKITLKKGKWPEKVRFALKLGNLEELAITSQNQTVHTNFKAAGKTWISKKLTDGKVVADGSGPVVKIEAEDQWLVFDIPRELLKSNSVEVGWINEFRN